METFADRIAALAGQLDAAVIDDPGRTLPRTVVDGVHEELASLGEPLHGCALELAVHRTVTPASLDALPPAELARMPPLLERLAERGVFVADEDRFRTWRCHPLVHRAAVQRLHARNPDASRHRHDRLVAALLRAAADADLEGDILFHARWAARWDVLSMMWTRAGAGLMLRHPELVRWAYRSSSPEVMRRYPELRLAELFATTASPGIEAGDDARLLRAIAAESATALSSLHQAADLDGVLSAGTLHIIALCRHGDIAGSNEWVDAVEQEAATRQGAHSMPWVSFALASATARLMAGRILDALHYAGTALAEAEELPDGEALAVSARGLLALVNLILGWTDAPPVAVVRDANRVPDVALPQPWSDRADLPWRIALAHIAADRLDAGALAEIVDGLGDPDGETPWWAFIVVARVLRAMAEGLPLAQIPELDRVASHHRRWLIDDSFPARLLNRCRVELLVAGGELQRAADILATHDPLPPELRVPMARVYLQSGRAASAREYTARVLADPALTPRERGTFETILAAAHIDLEESDAAAAVLRDMLLRAGGPPPGFTLQMMLLSVETRMRLLTLLPEGALPDEITARLATGIGPAPGIASQVVSLTRRERVILEELRAGDTLADVAARLSVSLNTVKKQAHEIYRKLGVPGRAEAVQRAMLLGLLPAQPDR